MKKSKPVPVEVVAGKGHAEFRMALDGCTCSVVIPVTVDAGTAIGFVAGISPAVLDFILHLNGEANHGSGN